MGHWRFRRSIGNKFFKVNISKTGFSTTTGVPGLHVNADLSNRRKKMFMNTFGLPGTGLSYRTDSYGPRKQQPSAGGDDFTAFVIGVIILFVLYMYFFGG